LPCQNLIDLIRRQILHSISQALGFPRAKSFFIILGATALAAFANFAVQFVLARTLGPFEFGAFYSALAMVTLVSPIAAFGVGSWWLRVFGEEGYCAQRWVKASLKFATISSFSVVALLIAWASLGPHDNLTGMLIAALTWVVLAQVTIDLVNAKFQLEAKHMGLAAWQLVSHPLRLVGLILLILYLPLLTAFHVAFLYLAISALVLLMGYFCLAGFYNGELHLASHSKTNFLKTKGYAEESSLKSVLLRTSPFGLQSVLFLFYYQTDVILLRYLVNEEAAGFYGASVTFMAAVYLLPSVLYQKYLLPQIHRWAYEKRNQLRVFIKRGAVMLFLVGILITFLMSHGASYLIPRILGEGYYPSVPLLTLMSLGIPFRYLVFHLGSVLSTRDFIWINLKLTGFTALLSVLLNILLIPQYGALGAALAMVISDLCLATLFVVATRNYFNVYDPVK
jgi:O-antigen/teichoic acid export membrane protein